MINLGIKFEVCSLNFSGDIETSQNSKSRSRDPFTTLFDLILHFFVRIPHDQSVRQIWSF